MPHPVDQLRDELREHAKEDLDAIKGVRAEVAEVRTDVKDLVKSQAAQTATLARQDAVLNGINARLSDVLDERKRQRDREDTKETAKLATRSGIWIAALKTIGVIAAAALTGYFTYLASH